MKKHPSPWTPLDLSRVRTDSLSDRPSKVHQEALARPYRKGASFREFLEGLPRILAARELLEVAQTLARITREGRWILVGIGAHVIKTGLSPVLIQAMEQGMIQGVAMNGAGMIHDAELALVGKTSEDVDHSLDTGDFGMAQETAAFLNGVVREGAQKDMGMGEAVGRALLEARPPGWYQSILAQGVRLGVPVTIHVALGTDIVHMHPSADGAAIGKTSLQDFHLFCRLVTQLEGGAYLNIGSAVILPEVFLKALNVARNLGYRVHHLLTVNLDFLRHYRPETNVVRRPTRLGGRGISLTGHHELLVPLLFAAWEEFREEEKGAS